MKGSVIEKQKILEHERQKRDLELCTFKPKINKLRAKTHRRNPTLDKKDGDENQGAEQQFDTFTKLNKPYRQYEKYKKDKIQQELEACTFKP